MPARFSFIFVLCFASGAAPVAAQEEASDDEPVAEDGDADTPEEYRALVQQALAESAAGRWREARALFVQAHALLPNARSARGLGMVSFELRDYAEAVRHLRQALADERRALDEAQREETEALLARTLTFVGVYDPPTLPEGGRLSIDGRDAAVEPDGTILLEIGDHHARVTTPDREWESRFEVRGGEREALPIVIDTPAEVPTPAETAAASEERDAPREPLEPPPVPTVTWVAIFGGGAVLIAGVSFLVAGVAAAARVEKADIGTEWSTLIDDQDQAIVFSSIGIAAMAVGGASLVGGLFWISVPRTVEGDVAGLELGLRGTL